MLTMRSTGSSNSSHPRSSTRRERSVSTESRISWPKARWFLLNVSPTTFTSYFSIARFIIDAHPQPTSSSVMPGCRPSLPSDRSILASCACCSVMSSRSKYAQL
jgi:hypothetical protein